MSTADQPYKKQLLYSEVRGTSNNDVDHYRLWSALCEFSIKRKCSYNRKHLHIIQPGSHTDRAIRLCVNKYDHEFRDISELVA